MAIIGSNVVYITQVGFQGGQKSASELAYYPTANPLGATAAQFADHWESLMVPLFQALLSDSYEIAHLDIKIRGPAFNDDLIRPINVFGSIAGDVCSPWLAYSFRKFPDNQMIEGANTNPFRLGGFRLGGIPESYQNNGLLLPFVSPLMENLTDQLDNIFVPIAVGDEPYRMFMLRPALTPFGPPDSAAPVLSLAGRSTLGSQNSRKYL